MPGRVWSYTEACLWVCILDDAFYRKAQGLSFYFFYWEKSFEDYEKGWKARLAFGDSRPCQVLIFIHSFCSFAKEELNC